jgi:hypothetical protein
MPLVLLSAICVLDFVLFIVVYLMIRLPHRWGRSMTAVVVVLAAAAYLATFILLVALGVRRG